MGPIQELYGYRKNPVKTALIWIAIVLSLFILRLIFHWKPGWMLFCTHDQCSLEEAERVLVVDEFGRYFIEDVKFITSTDVSTETIDDLNQDSSNIPVPGDQGEFVDTEYVRYFDLKKIRFLWLSDEFQRLRGLDYVPCEFFHRQTGLSRHEQARRRALYGHNIITVAVQSFYYLLLWEALNPFYVFQAFSVMVWFGLHYYYFGAFILLMSGISIVVTIRYTQKNQRDLRSTIQSLQSTEVTVRRGKFDYDTISVEELVPGDVICIPTEGYLMQCDAVLISGNCIVKETTLTGESVPLTKTPIPAEDKLYNAKDHARHTLFSGTKVIQNRYYGKQEIIAVVIRTGFNTTQGELVRSIIFPKPVDFKFHRDALKFIGLLLVLGSIGFVYVYFVEWTLTRKSPSYVMLQALDLFTIVLPPVLPFAMTISVLYAQARLKRQGIYCTSPRTINMSGCINCVCFDKTGTLTAEDIDLFGVIPAKGKLFEPIVHRVDTLPQDHQVLLCMATCHSLTMIDEKLSGDPLELKMFEATGWTLEDQEIDASFAQPDLAISVVVLPKFPMEKDKKFSLWGLMGIVRYFTFSSDLQRMSVIVLFMLGSRDRYFQLYTKGSPEVIAGLSDPETVPDNVDDVVQFYARQGYRILAMATKKLSGLSSVGAMRISREEVESGLTFLGLLVAENELKPETRQTIDELKKADIKICVVTGDDLLTTLRVVRNCEMIENSDKIIRVDAVKTSSEESVVEFHSVNLMDNEMLELKMSDSQVDIGDTRRFRCGPRVVRSAVDVEEPKAPRFHFAVKGDSFSVILEHFPELIPKLAVRGTIFARMSFEQKRQLVAELQDCGYYVAYCGDGSNDCAALKTAHAGISLSDSQTSIAAPFTVREGNISCVPTVIREGRASLVTSFGMFKYMACYSLTQTVSMMILYFVDSHLTSIQFLYVDLILVTTLATFYGRTEAHPVLDRLPPPVRLIAFKPLARLTTQMIIHISAQTIAFIFVQAQPWWRPFEPKDENDFSSAENYAIFTVTGFQYIIPVIIFSTGAPYRKPMYTNYPFLAAIVVLSLFSVYVTLSPAEWLRDLLDLWMPEDVPFRLVMLAIAAVNFIICILCDTILVPVFEFIQRELKFFHQNPPFVNIENEIEDDPDWPPVGPQAAANSSGLSANSSSSSAETS